MLENAETRHASGVFCLNPEFADDPVYKRFILDQAFLAPAGAVVIKTNNRNLTYTLSFSPGKEVVLKRTRPGEGYPPLRKLSLWVRMRLRGYSRRAYLGALRLRRAGVNTFNPIAYWTRRRDWFRVESYLMYEKIRADCVMREFGEQARSDPARAALYGRMLDELVAMTRRMHDHGLRHGDIATHNVLVQFGRGPAEPEFRLFLLDTDHVTRSRFSFPTGKLFFDLRCLQRLDFDAVQRRYFLKKYLGPRYREVWWRVLEAWRWWEGRPLKHLRRCCPRIMQADQAPGGVRQGNANAEDRI